MIFFQQILFKKSFFGLLFLGVNLAFGQMPFDKPYLAFFSLIGIGWLWVKFKPSKQEALIWGLGCGFGYFSITFSWIIEPFLVIPEKTGWMAPFALLGMGTILSIIWAMCFYLAALLGRNQNATIRILSLWIMLTFSELIRSEWLFNFPWGLIASIWINTPISQSLSLFGPYWLSSLTILAAFLLTRPIMGSLFGLLIALLLYGFGHVRLNEETINRLEPIKIRIIQPNIEQSEKWKPDLARDFLNLQIDLSKNSIRDNINLIVWPETAISYFLDKDKNLQKALSEQLGSPIVIGGRRFDENENKLFNSAFLLNNLGDITAVYDKISLVPFGEYIPLSNFFSRSKFFGLATDGITGFSKGKLEKLITTQELKSFLIFICYESIFSEKIDNASIGASWLLQITNDAWFGKFNGPQQHLTLARMRAIEQGLPLARSANTGISAIIDSYGRIKSNLMLGELGRIDGFIPAALDNTFYSLLGAQFWNKLLCGLLILTIGVLILIKNLNKRLK